MKRRAPRPRVREPREALVDQLFALMGVILRQGRSHPGAVAAARELRERVATLGPPFCLRLIRGAIYLDEELVPLAADSFARGQQVSRALWNLGHHEIRFTTVPEADQLQTLGSALARGAQVASDVLQRLQLDGIEFDAIPCGAADEQIEPSRLARSELRHAVDAVEQLGTAPPGWSWQHGIAATRHLERALEADPQASVKALGAGIDRYAAPRRAVGAAVFAHLALTAVGASTLTRRAAAHAALAIGSYGYADRGGLATGDAAAKALGALLSGMAAADPAPPHHMRVCSMVRAVKLTHARLDDHSAVAAGGGLVALLTTCYLIERGRVTQELPLTLDTAEALARTLAEYGAHAWGRALVLALGGLPAGAAVMVDGRLGFVEGPGDPMQPLRPRVLHGTSTAVPEPPAVLHSPLTAS